MPAPALRELEAAFWRSIARTPGDAPFDVDRVLAGAVCTTGALTPEARLGIYARMYYSRLLDALRADFPRTAAVLGDGGFAALVQAYLARHPSAHPSIRHLGRKLAEHVAACPPAGAPAFLAALVRLEWARLEVFDAPDAPPLTLDDLRALPPEEWPGLALAVVPAFALLVLDWPVERVWAATDAQIAPARTVLRVWREGFAVYHASVGAREEAALARLRAGEPFGGVCEAFADLPDAESAAEAGALLVSWVRDGVVRRAASPGEWGLK